MQMVCGGAMSHLNACVMLPCFVTQEGDMLSTARCLRLCSSTCTHVADLPETSTCATAECGIFFLTALHPAPVLISKAAQRHMLNTV